MKAKELGKAEVRCNFELEKLADVGSPRMSTQDCPSICLTNLQRWYHRTIHNAQCII